MKKSIPLALAIVFITFSYGLKADTISYQYTHSYTTGNVVSKSINIELESTANINTSSIQRVSYEDPTEVGKIIIYPNPATCEVRIQFNGVEWNQNNNRTESWTISLYSMQGILLKTVNCQGHIGKIIITSFPMGMYFLQVDRGGLRRSYPLIKK